MPALTKAGMVNLMPKRLKSIAKFLEYAELTADIQQRIMEICCELCIGVRERKGGKRYEKEK